MSNPLDSAFSVARTSDATVFWFTSKFVILGFHCILKGDIELYTVCYITGKKRVKPVRKHGVTHLFMHNAKVLLAF